MNDYLNGHLGTDTDTEPEKIQAIAPGSYRIKFTSIDGFRLHWRWPCVKGVATVRTAKLLPDGAPLTTTSKPTFLNVSRLNSFMFHTGQGFLHIVPLKQNLFRIFIIFLIFAASMNSLFSPFLLASQGFLPLCKQQRFLNLAKFILKCTYFNANPRLIYSDMRSELKICILSIESWYFYQPQKFLMRLTIDRQPLGEHVLKVT